MNANFNDDDGKHYRKHGVVEPNRLLLISQNSYNTFFGQMIVVSSQQINPN